MIIWNGAGRPGGVAALWAHQAQLTMEITVGFFLGCSLQLLPATLLSLYLSLSSVVILVVEFLRVVASETFIGLYGTFNDVIFVKA